MKTETRVVQYTRKALEDGRAFEVLDGLSNTDIGHDTGVHRSNVYRWRHRQGGISTSSALKLGRLLLALDDQAPADLREAVAVAPVRA